MTNQPLHSGPGRGETFAEFVLRTGPGYRKTALRAADGDPHVAEDVLQDAYLRLMKAWPRVSARGDVRSYGFTVVRNAARDYFRSHRRLVITAELPEQADPAHGGIPDAELTDLGVRVAELIDALPERQRQAVVLTYIEGKEVAEAAQEMRVHPGTVARYLHAALRRMHDEMLQETAIKDVTA